MTRREPLLKDGDVVERLKQFRLRWQESGDLTYLGKALTDAVIEIERLRPPAAEPLCEDEGCDHYGTPHVCVSTVDHDKAVAEMMRADPKFAIDLITTAMTDLQHVIRQLVMSLEIRDKGDG